MPEPGTPGATGAFLSCMGEKVNTYRPIDGRQWNTTVNNGSSSPLPGSPITSTPKSSGSEYFGHQNVDSAPASPATADFAAHVSNDGGRVKKPRSSSSAGGVPKPMAKGRRRPSSAGSVSSRRGSGSDAGASSGALWQVDIGETSVWTIVGTGTWRFIFSVFECLLISVQIKFATTSMFLLFYLTTNTLLRLGPSPFLPNQ
jgi:hypothetical protein